MSEEELRGEVLTVDPPQLLEFRWGDHHIRCELVSDGAGCKFLLSETFEDASMGARNAAGWEMCLENLDLILQGVTLAKFALDVWRGKFSHYVKKFKSEFGPQQGPPPNHPGVAAEKNQEG